MRLGTHQYFAADHIRSAKLMADKCRHREDECVNDKLPVLDFEIRSYALAAITESVAFFLRLWSTSSYNRLRTSLMKTPGLAGLDRALWIACVASRSTTTRSETKASGQVRPHIVVRR